MIRQKLTIAAATAFALSISPVWADQRSRPAGSESTGSAQPRGGGESSAGSSSGSSSPSGSSSQGSSSGSSGSWMGGSSSRAQPVRAPERPARAEQRDRGGAPSSGTAVPRGSSGGGSSDGGASTRGSGDTSSSAGSNDNSDGNRAVPTYSRPREGRNPQGTAVDRRGPGPGSGGGSVYYPGVIYDPYYYRYGYYDPFYSNRFTSYWSPFGYGYGLGYFAYDPYMYGGGYPSGYGGYGYDSYGGYGANQRYGETGSLRLKVKPSNAQVHIDGYYVGVIDSYDGAFQKLNIEAGPHRIELRAEGYEPAQFEVMVIPGETITYKGELKRIR